VIQMKSLKTRILIFLGLLIIILLILISISVLYQWRSLIVENQRRNALSIAQTFSLYILDALIYQESGLLQAEGLIENHIHNFMAKNDQVKFIELYDQNGHAVVRSDYSNIDLENEKTGKLLVDPAESALTIYQSEIYGWILEVKLPLQIHSKSWGLLRMGFDANTMRHKLNQLFFTLFSFTILFIAIVMTAIYFRIDRLTRSLSQLVAEMNDFDLNNMAPMQMPASDDEIGFLVTNFEKMTNRLRQSRKQLLQAQKQMHQAEKLASIGRLASGVAHEINNPLHGLKSCLYAIEKEPHNLPQMVRYLALANEGIDHIALIVQKLLGFSHQQAKQVTKINLNEQINMVLSLLQFRIEQSRILLEMHLESQLPLIEADPHLIQEVLMNLLLNALDSFEADGKITITTATENDHTIGFTIADTGCGIADKNLDKIFDPFFTTKEEGRGTGLGLSVTLGIVEMHGGAIQVQSTVGIGTSFQVTLPIEENR